MSHLREIVKFNGDSFRYYQIFKCDKCAIEVEESHPRYANDLDDEHYCLKCGFILGLLSKEFYLKHCGISLKDSNVGVNPDGEIVIWTGNRKPPWEKTNKEQRNTKEYRDWRTSVFERDKYTCQICNKVGGDLNAHHIKPFATHKELRFDINNGLTLCVKCHKEIHRQKEVG